MNGLLAIDPFDRARYALIALILFFTAVSGVLAEEEKGAYDTQVPPGMELKKVGNKDSYRVVVPKGTTFRRQGDLRIVEGSGEYLSRALLDYGARLDRMDSAIEAMQKDIEDIKIAISDMRKTKLASKED
jgi:hypothetical protein